MCTQNSKSNKHQAILLYEARLEMGVLWMYLGFSVINSMILWILPFIFANIYSFSAVQFLHDNPGLRRELTYLEIALPLYFILQIVYAYFEYKSVLFLTIADIKTCNDCTCDEVYLECFAYLAYFDTETLCDHLEIKCPRCGKIITHRSLPPRKYKL